MKNRHRYTGCWPPPTVLGIYPNWVFALDEEDEDGQDETTIKPESQQLYVSEETSFTAADITLASGTTRTGILTLDGTIPSAGDVFDGRDWWTVQRGPGTKWEAVRETWIPEDQRRPTVSLNDREIFPLNAHTRLPKSDGKIVSVTVFPDGATVLS